jgi:hypothetical protein
MPTLVTPLATKCLRRITHDCFPGGQSPVFSRRDKFSIRSWWICPVAEKLTVTELEQRWKNALMMTQAAVARHPAAYRDLKSLALDIVAEPLDIKEYLQTVEKLVALLETLDPQGRGSIFYFFSERIAPSSIWDVSWLRMECNDLLAHLKVFDEWRRKNHPLKRVK